MNEKMWLDVEDESDTSLISKKFWKHVKSKTNSTRITETVWYKKQFRSKPIDQANLFKGEARAPVGTRSLEPPQKFGHGP